MATLTVTHSEAGSNIAGDGSFSDSNTMTFTDIDTHLYYKGKVTNLSEYITGFPSSSDKQTYLISDIWGAVIYDHPKNTGIGGALLEGLKYLRITNKTRNRTLEFKMTNYANADVSDGWMGGYLALKENQSIVFTNQDPTGGTNNMNYSKQILMSEDSSLSTFVIPVGGTTVPFGNIQNIQLNPSDVNSFVEIYAAGTSTEG